MPPSPSFPSGIHNNLKILFFFLSFFLLNSSQTHFNSNFLFFFHFLNIFCSIILFFTENRTKWRRKRKRESHKRHSKRHDEDDEDNDSDDDDNNDSDDQFRSPNAPPNTDPRVEIEVVSRDGVQISRFPPAIRRAVTRPHAAVTAIAALEFGRGHSQHGVPVLENVSHGQLQASSTVTADCLGGSSFVAAPPPVMKGSGVVKRFGTRVLVVPMHSGSSFELVFFIGCNFICIEFLCQV